MEILVFHFLFFVKEINYSDKEGTYINDRRIKITIEFDTCFDYKSEYNNTNDDKAHHFIKQIIDNTYN